MSIEQQLKEKGWTECRCSIETRNAGTGKIEYLDWADRLISPDGNTTYRPGTGVMRSMVPGDNLCTR